MDKSQWGGGYAIVSPTNQGFYRLVAPSRLNHVLITGQSLAMGAYASNILSTNQRFENRMFVGQRLDGGAADLQPDDLSALVPLVEHWDPEQGGGETIASSFANWVANRAGPGVHDLLVSNCARGGTAYTGLQRTPSGDYSQSASGTYPYLRGLNQVAAAKALLGTDCQFRAVLVVHGESDLLNVNYGQDIRAWQQDFQFDIQQATGQTNVIPMFHSQASCWGRVGIPERVWSPFETLEESEVNPARTILVCPKYMLPYDSDGIHLTSEGYRWLGEYYGKAYYQQIVSGQPWSPVRPVQIVRTNNEITVAFTGVVGHLVFDTGQVSDPQSTTTDPTGSPDGGPELVNIGPYGFEYWDDAGTGSPWACSTTVLGVELQGPNTVKIVLNQAPQGANRRLRYAFTPAQILGPNISGWAVQSRGCLRDTDPSPSLCGNTLYNWCVHFDKTMPMNPRQGRVRRRVGWLSSRSCTL